MNFIRGILGTVFAATTFNLIFVLRYTLLFTALLVLLPLTAFPTIPAHDLIGGLFLELSPLAVGLVTVGFLGTAWSLMFVQGLLVDAVTVRSAPGEHHEEDDPSYRGIVRGGPISDRAQQFFNLRTTPGQRWAYFAVALPAIVIVISQSTSVLLASLSAIIASVITYLTMVVLCYPGKAVDPTFDPMANSKAAGVIFGLLDRATPLTRFLCFVRSLFTAVLRPIAAVLPPFRCVLDKENRLRAGHFFAIMNFLLLALVFLLVAIALHPGKDLEPPAAIYFYIMISLLVWLFGAIQFFVSRYHIPPVLVVVLTMAIGYRLTRTHHRFEATVVDVPASETALNPVTIVQAGKQKQGKNLVVVAATGGGILASGWFTIAMERLIAERPELKDEIRLLSTVSGSSTGAAFYLDGLLRHGVTPDSSPAAVNEALGEIFKASTDSSLAASTYGFAFLDFWRMASGGVLPRTKDDRGTLLQQRWLQNAKARAGKPDPGSLALRDLRAGIRDGSLPAVIFNGTIMERGQRVMMTPVDFAPVLPNTSSRRARTLSELYRAPDRKRVDVSIWTAARMSASFPYVTPAARADFEPDLSLGGDDSGNRRGYHLIDGGYYDNYGIASTKDWLDPVLRAREAGELDFDRVLIIQLRAFEVPPPGQAPTSSAAAAALFGPLIGIINIYSGAARTRNEIDMNRFVESWNKRLDNVDVRTVIMERRTSTGPLSWHLTSDQIVGIREAWPEAPEGTPPSDLPVGSPAIDSTPRLAERWAWINRFLNGDYEKSVR